MRMEMERVWLVCGGLGGPHIGLSTAVAVALNCGARRARQIVHTVQVAGVAVAPTIVRPGFVPTGLAG